MNKSHKLKCLSHKFKFHVFFCFVFVFLQVNFFGIRKWSKVVQSPSIIVSDFVEIKAQMLPFYKEEIFLVFCLCGFWAPIKRGLFLSGFQITKTWINKVIKYSNLTQFWLVIFIRWFFRVFKNQKLIYNSENIYIYIYKKKIKNVIKSFFENELYRMIIFEQWPFSFFFSLNEK